MIKQFKKSLIILSVIILAFSANTFAVTKGADVVYSEVAEEKGLTLGLASRELFNYRSEIAWPDGPEIDAEGAYLVEINTGSVLYSKSFNQQFYPASITKILTALVVIENCDDLDEMVTFSKNAVHDIEEGGFSWICEVGDQLSVRDCLYALMLHSSNECAYALAEHFGGSIQGFTSMMNEKAKEVGAYNSNFANPHGLTNPDHVTTPHDMACIMWAAIQNPVFLKIDSTVTYRTAPTTTNPEGFFCNMRHSMMRNTDYHDDRVIAGKTGYISAAKNTLVTYAKDGDKELIAVVMRTNGTGQACIDTKKLLDYGFNSFEITPVPSGVELDALKSEISQKATDLAIEGVSYDDTIDIIHPKNSSVPELKWSMELSDSNEGSAERKGEITFFLGEKVVAKRDVSVSFIQPASQEESRETLPDTSAPEISSSKTILIVILSVAAAALIATAVIFIKISSRPKTREKGTSRRKK
ncbi:MAG: D-alanyl-D-alanine carboxypeptidase [Lachnospiraceae bacterium]|nr:D-alanyl-D-alanine carboxypeptidase [Lachnospiraceae bacterium]